MKFEYTTFPDRKEYDGVMYTDISLLINGPEFLLAKYNDQKYNELRGIIVSYVYFNDMSYIFSKSDFKVIETWLDDESYIVEFAAVYHVSDPNKKWLEINVLRSVGNDKYVVIGHVRKSRVLSDGDRDMIMMRKFGNKH